MGAYCNVADFAFRDLYRLSAGPSNDHYCYVLYDDSEKYDIDCNLELVCYSRLPDYVEGIIPPDKKADFDKSYRIVEKAEWIIVDYMSALYNILSEYFTCPGPNCCMFITPNRHLVCCQYDDHTEILLMLKYTYLEKLIPIEAIFSYDESGTNRGIKTQLLQERKEKLTGPDALPRFENFDELSQFLEEVTPYNKLEIDSATDAQLYRILYELIYFASNLYPGADLSTLVPGVFDMRKLYPLIDMFKPIYSRYAWAGTVTTCSDPVGDWLALTDSFELHSLHTPNSYIDLTDTIKFRIIQVRVLHGPHELCLLADNVKKLSTKVLTTSLNLSDQVEARSATFVYDGNQVYDKTVWT